jgi:hypothetical protein
VCVRIYTLKSRQYYLEDYRVKGISKHRSWKQWKPAEHRTGPWQLKSRKWRMFHGILVTHTQPAPNWKGHKKRNGIIVSEVTKRDLAVKLCIRVLFFERNACKNEVLIASASR